MNQVTEKKSTRDYFANRKAALSVILFCFVVGILTTPYIGCATMSYAILVVGMSLRKKNVSAHANLMKIGMGIDVLLVLILEVTRSAIATTVSFKLGPFQQTHILFSALAVVGYVPLLFLGTKILNQTDRDGYKQLHKRIGIMTFTFRTIGFILMFSMLSAFKS